MIELIPAIYIIDGKCLSLSQGEYHPNKMYTNNQPELDTEF